jgi:Dioxygenase/Protocatechuate 3,4-dioxygenase beta subunit N terminal
MKAAAESARAVPQRAITAQIARIAADYQGKDEAQPLLDYPPYRSNQLRHPRFPFVCVDPDEVECWAPCFGRREVDALDADLTAGHPGEPIGERIIVTGRLLDATGKPVAGQLVEIWQANAAGCNGVVDAYQQLSALLFPVQIGGAGGTLAATTELAALTGHPNPAGILVELVQNAAATLGLDASMPWHSQCSELLAGPQVHPARMEKNLDGTDMLGEQRVTAELVGKAQSDNYFGVVDALIDEGLDRAKRTVKERP